MRSSPELQSAYESVFTGHYQLGRRPDGSHQQIITFGALHRHSNMDPEYHGYLYGQTQQAWGLVKSQVADLSRLKVFLEGRVRRPDVSLSSRQVFGQYGEVGLFEVLARDAGVPESNLMSAEPGHDKLRELSQIYGPNAVSDYLAIRFIPQWVALPDELRPPLPAYILRQLHGRYKNAIPPEAYQDGWRFGYASLEQRWRQQFPEADPLWRQPASEALASWARQQTFIEHTELMSPIDRTEIQEVSVVFNWMRDQTFVERIANATDQGYDVAFCAGDAHLRVIHADLLGLEVHAFRQVL